MDTLHATPQSGDTLHPEGFLSYVLSALRVDNEWSSEVRRLNNDAERKIRFGKLGSIAFGHAMLGCLPHIGRKPKGSMVTLVNTFLTGEAPRTQVPRILDIVRQAGWPNVTSESIAGMIASGLNQNKARLTLQQAHSLANRIFPLRDEMPKASPQPLPQPSPPPPAPVPQNNPPVPPAPPRAASYRKGVRGKSAKKTTATFLSEQYPFSPIAKPLPEEIRISLEKHLTDHGFGFTSGSLDNYIRAARTSHTPKERPAPNEASVRESERASAKEYLAGRFVEKTIPEQVPTAELQGMVDELFDERGITVSAEDLAGMIKEIRPTHNAKFAPKPPKRTFTNGFSSESLWPSPEQIGEEPGEPQADGVTPSPTLPADIMETIRKRAEHYSFLAANPQGLEFLSELAKTDPQAQELLTRLVAG